MRPRWPRCGQPFYGSRDEMGREAWRVCSKPWGHWFTTHRGPLAVPPAHDPMGLLEADERPHPWPGKHTGGQM